jgi:AcrR family transcriptional regulator
VAEPVARIGAPRRTLGRQARAHETRRRLIRSAARLWGERGFESVTVEEICSDAGVGRTTFYLHFESKERLLAGLAWATGAGVASDVDAVRSSPLDEQLDVFIGGVTRRMEDVPRSLAELVIHSYRAEPLRVDDLAEGAPRFADVLREVLTAARRRGELVRAADPAELGEVLGALTMDAIAAWSSGRSGDRRLDAVLRSRFALVLDQLRTPSGLAASRRGTA